MMYRITIYRACGRKAKPGDDRRLFAVEHMPTRWLMPTLDHSKEGDLPRCEPDLYLW